MLTHILHNSPSLCTFIEHLQLPLSQPQLQHVRNLADAVLVCDAPKTLAAWQRQFVECVDVSNMADTLRIAPWTAADLHQPVGTFLLRDALAQARADGTLKFICISLDDSLTTKHKHTRHLEGVDWHYDHTASTPHQPHFKNGLAYLGCNVWVGNLAFTFDVQPYLREKTVRRLNRHRRPDARLSFRSKLHMARPMLCALHDLLPTDVPVYVLHDT